MATTFSATSASADRERIQKDLMGDNLLQATECGEM